MWISELPKRVTIQLCSVTPGPSLLVTRCQVLATHQQERELNVGEQILALFTQVLACRLKLEVGSTVNIHPPW